MIDGSEDDGLACLAQLLGAPMQFLRINVQLLQQLFISGGDFVRCDAEGNVLLDTRIHPYPLGRPARFIESLAPHSIENVGTSEIHLISVELKP